MCDFIFEHRERQRKKHFCLLRCLSAFATPIKLYFRCVFKLLPYVALALETAVMCATENPAKEIGIYDKVGSISVGKQADFVLIDEELNIKRVYIDGKEIIC